MEKITSGDIVIFTTAFGMKLTGKIGEVSNVRSLTAPTFIGDDCYCAIHLKTKHNWSTVIFKAEKVTIIKLLTKC